MNSHEILEKLVDVIGINERYLLDEIVRYLSNKEAIEMLEDIAHTNDIEL